MKRTISLVLTFVLLFASVIGATGCKKEYSVPDFTVYDAGYNPHKLEDFIGKPIVLNFWATWCYYCAVEMPAFDEAARKYDNVQFLMINHTDGINETVSGASYFISQNGYSFPVFYDVSLEASEKYNVEAFPTTVFINKDGELVKRHEGMMSLELLESYIDLID